MPRVIDEVDARNVLQSFLHYFRHEDQWYAFATWANRLWLLTESEEKLISDFIREKPINAFTDIEQDFIVDLYKNCKPTLKRQIIEFDNQIESMVLLVTEACNFACTYCYGSYPEKQSVMKVDIAKKSVDLAIKLGVKELIFFGGEPLLNFQLIKEIVEYTECLSFQGALRITTNGSLITDSIAAFLAEHNIEVSVSMDGSRTQHDLTRVFKDGSSSYDSVVQGIECLKKYHALSLIEVTYSARHDKDLDDQVRAALNLHPVVSCACVDGKRGCKHSSDVICGERMAAFYEKVLDLSKNLDDKNIVLGVDELYQKICNGEVLESPPCLCSDLVSRMVVFADGRISPCPELSDDKYTIGNVKDITPSEFLKNRAIILEKLSSDKLKKEWFSSLFETCIQHVIQNGDSFVYENAKSFSDCAESLIIRYAKENA